MGQALSLMLAFSTGGCTKCDVAEHLETGLDHSCTTKCVAHPIWVDWLIQNWICWAAIGRGSDDALRGPVALFRATEM